MVGRQDPPFESGDPFDDARSEDVPINAYEAAWPFNADSPQVAGLVREDRFLAILLVDVTGLDWEAITEHLPMIREISGAKEMVPVLVVDIVDYRGLIEAELAYDVMPNVPLNGALAEDLDWEGYLSWRRQLLRLKWRPSAIINLGLARDWDAP